MTAHFADYFFNLTIYLIYIYVINNCVFSGSVLYRVNSYNECAQWKDSKYLPF